VAVIGGLITSTILSLVLVPVVYEFVDDFESWLLPRLGRLVTPREAPRQPAPVDWSPVTPTDHGSAPRPAGLAVFCAPVSLRPRRLWYTDSMGLLVYLLVLVLVGLVVGALARLALPGPDPMSIPATIGFAP